MKLKTFLNRAIADKNQRELTIPDIVFKGWMMTTNGLIVLGVWISLMVIILK